MDNCYNSRNAGHTFSSNFCALLWNEMNIFNTKAIKDSLSEIRRSPFDYCIVDNFFDSNIARSLCASFPAYNSNIWHEYKNQIEDKKTCNNWNTFDKLTYNTFRELNSERFIGLISKIMKVKLYPDPGLNGGGWHIHANNGNLNPHLDYSIHPKINLQRRINLIIYLEREYKYKYGGHLGLWSHDSKTNQPGKLVKEIYPKFNRAIIFDTSQNSWHGLSRKISLPKNIYRKSIAVYYLSEFKKNHLTNQKALFAPRENQKHSKDVLNLIKMRSHNKLFKKAYKK